MTIALGASLVTTPAFASEITDKINDTKDSIEKTTALLQTDKKQQAELLVDLKEQKTETTTANEEQKTTAEKLTKAKDEAKEVATQLKTMATLLKATNINSASYSFTLAKQQVLAEQLKAKESTAKQLQQEFSKVEAVAQEETRKYQALTKQQDELIAQQETAEKTLATKKAQLNTLTAKKKAADKIAKEEAAKKAAAAAANQTTGIDHSNSGNAYAWGQCTWYVKTVAPWVGTYWGNGCQWATSAAADGYQVDGTPEVGSVVVFAAGQQGANAQYGHVGYVEAVNGEGTFTFSQGGLGFANPAGPNYQTLSAAGFQFIHKN